MSVGGAVAEEVARGTIRKLQRLIMVHPIAARAFVRAMIAEGREVAKTEQGRAWKKDLVGTPLFARVRVLWEACSLHMIEEDEAVLRPTVVLEAVLDAASDVALESSLSRLFAHGGEG
jgi:hypothetical protein